MRAPVPRPGILDIQPYRGGNAGLDEAAELINLAANETPFGASPRAIAAYRSAAGNLHRYPDGSTARLRAGLARHHGLRPECIMCGNGSDELISLLANAYGGPGSEIIHTRHAFAMYALAAQSSGATAISVPERDYTADPEAMIAAVTERTRIVFLANPNNPTGSYLAADIVARLRADLPDAVLLVVDSAYAEYVSRNDYSAGAELVEADENTVMLRTFSKIYGLAGLRIGWGYAPRPVIEVINRMRGPFNVNAAAQSAALAALADTAHTDAARAHNDLWLPKLSAGLQAFGLNVLPSIGNFVLARFGSADQAEAADRGLRDRGIIVRAMGGYGFPDGLRITVGSEPENTAVLAALGEILNVQHGG